MDALLHVYVAYYTSRVAVLARTQIFRNSWQPKKFRFYSILGHNLASRICILEMYSGGPRIQKIWLLDLYSGGPRIQIFRILGHNMLLGFAAFALNLPFGEWGFSSVTPALSLIDSGWLNRVSCSGSGVESPFDLSFVCCCCLFLLSLIVLYFCLTLLLVFTLDFLPCHSLWLTFVQSVHFSHYFSVSLVVVLSVTLCQCFCFVSPFSSLVFCHPCGLNLVFSVILCHWLFFCQSVFRHMFLCHSCGLNILCCQPLCVIDSCSVNPFFLIISLFPLCCQSLSVIDSCFLSVLFPH